MAITTWSGLLTELTRLIDGEDVTVSQVSVGTLTQIIAMGERNVYQRARTRYNQKAWGITTTANLAAIPTDFESTAIIHFGKKPLLPVSEAWMQEYLSNVQQSSVVKYFAYAGPNLTFGPSVADGTTVQGRYYCNFTPLSAASLPSNTMFLAYPEVFIYAALAESAPFFGQDARLPMWKALYAEYLDLANTDQQSAYSAGRAQVRPSTQLMR